MASSSSQSKTRSPLGGNVLTERNTNNSNNQRAVPAILSRKRKAEAPIDMNHLAPAQPMPVSLPSASSSPFGAMDTACYEQVPELEEAFQAFHQGTSNATRNSSKPCGQENQQPSPHANNQSSPASSRTPLATLSNSSNVYRRAAISAVSKRKQLPSLPPKAKKLKMRRSWSQFREFIRNTTTPSSSPAGSPQSSPLRGSTANVIDAPRATRAPFPTLRWADKDQVWRLICKKESGMYQRKTGEQIMARNPALLPRMRAILLDWIIEVCEVYRLHRETFYLAVDFIDRYLSSTKDMPKTRLQLIGVTALFIGAKIEEIYPPKLSEFAYVTDGACSEEEILSMELVLLKELNWGLSPMTPNSWMKMFMQVSNCDKSPENETFVTPQYSGLPFARVMQLLDLCMLDMASLEFRYSVLATAALAHTCDRTVALQASGYEWRDVAACAEWMSAFVQALREDAPVPATKTFHNVSAENQHNIQAHTVELSTLDRALGRLAQIRSRKSPEPSGSGLLLGDVLMTPPEEDGDVHGGPKLLFPYAQQ